jgi:hypothetical protein
MIKIFKSLFTILAIVNLSLAAMLGLSYLILWILPIYIAVPLLVGVNSVILYFVVFSYEKTR